MKLVSANSETGRLTTTSLIVAEYFGKNHRDVLRSIDNLSCSEDFSQRNFAQTEYFDAQGKSQRAIEMTRDGFTFLVMGFTGDKAGQFKEDFITAFNQAESLLKSDDYILLRAMSILNQKTRSLEEQLESNKNKLALTEKTVESMKPKVELFDVAMDATGLIDMGQVAKVLNLPFGRNKLFEKLRERGVLFKGRNEPKQEYINRGYFRVKEVTIDRPGQKPLIYMKVFATQKGLDAINKVFGGLRVEENQLAKIG